jgi:hypothetical protein
MDASQVAGTPLLWRLDSRVPAFAGTVDLRVMRSNLVSVTFDRQTVKLS